MALEVVTPAASYRLTTVAAFRAETKITASQMDDASVEALIDEASSLVSEYCGRVFARETVKETFADPCGALLLERRPVVEVVSISGVDASGYRLDNAAGIVNRRGSSHWPEDTEVTYTGGYILPGEEGRNLPVKVERATVLVAAAIASGGDRDTLLKSETVDDVVRLDYWVPSRASGLPHPEAEGLLQSFVAPSLA